MKYFKVRETEREVGIRRIFAGWLVGGRSPSYSKLSSGASTKVFKVIFQAYAENPIPDFFPKPLFFFIFPWPE